jgi:ECF transporter S component (folate family)
MNVQSRYCALSVRGWEVAPKRRILSAIQCCVRCHIQEILISARHFLLFVVASLPFKEKGGAFFMDNSKIRRVSIAGFLIAVSIVLSRFFAGDMVVGGLSILRISFGPVPIYISSLLLGPFYGSITGGVADALGYLVKPLGPYSPGFTINGILTGLMPALLARFYREKESWWRIFLIIAPVEIVTSLLLTPLWLSMLTGKAFIVFVPSNLISKVFLIPIYVTLIKIILKLSRQTIPALK